MLTLSTSAGHLALSLRIAVSSSQGEMKMPVCIEDDCNPDLPPASLLFRSARQYAYGVLFSLAETHRRLERMAMRKRAPLEGKARGRMQGAPSGPSIA